MKIVITGFMGSGKTRTARELARRLDLEMIDLDERITASTGRSPAQLIVDEGEEAFRAIESDVLRELLGTNTGRVIALGGGAWIQEVNRALISEHDFLSVWLDVPFEVCWSRIETSSEVRPLGRTKEEANRLYDQRKPIYQLANVRIEIGNEDFDELIAHIERQLGHR